MSRSRDLTRGCKPNTEVGRTVLSNVEGHLKSSLLFLSYYGRAFFDILPDMKPIRPYCFKLQCSPTECAIKFRRGVSSPDFRMRQPKTSVKLETPNPDACIRLYYVILHDLTRVKFSTIYISSNTFVYTLPWIKAHTNIIPTLLVDIKFWQLSLKPMLQLVR